MRAFDILLRIIANIIFYFLSKWLVGSLKVQLSSADSTEPVALTPVSRKLTCTQKLKQLALDLMIRSLISTDFVKLTTSALLICSTNVAGVDTLDFCVIILDIMNLSYFQILVFRAYFHHSGKQR